MGYFRPHTKRGYNLFEVASCLQKAIRRGDTELAGYMAIEMFESGFHAYAWKRLLTISAEDCAGIITQEIKALFDSFIELNKNSEKVRSRIFMSKAVIVLCRSRKCRDADVLTNFVYDRQMIDATKLTQAIDEARRNPENIELPEYTFDVHTKKGRGKGKTKEDFFKDEDNGLMPRDEQTEFSTLVNPQHPTQPND